MNDGVPTFTYNYIGLKQSDATASTPLPQGKSTVKMDFAYDGGDPGSGGMATLYIDGKKVGSARIEKTQCCIFSADESAGVGIDTETTVSSNYDREGSKFSANIEKVTINLK